MEARQFLERERKAIVAAADSALTRSGARHYQAAGEAEVHLRLEALFDHLLGALVARDLGEMIS